MLTCKLCNTRLGKKHLRRDGSMLCPECGQIYWKAAVDAAISSTTRISSPEEIKAKYSIESRRSVAWIRAQVAWWAVYNRTKYYYMCHQQVIKACWYFFPFCKCCFPQLWKMTDLLGFAETDFCLRSSPCSCKLNSIPLYGDYCYDQHWSSW